MALNAERRRYRRLKPLPGQRDITIIYETGSGPSMMEGKLCDFSEGGLSIELTQPLSPGSSVEISGEIEGLAGPQLLRKRGLIHRCTNNGNGTYVVGMSYQDGNGSREATKEIETDYYEVLQLSRNANPDTIQRVFRMLAKRYHPDNLETGNPDLFREVVEAARVLSDPKLRAAFDARLCARDQNRFKIFEAWQTSRGVDAEKRKRKGVLDLLYRRRLTDPQHPTLGLRDLEEMLECPREHLEFTIWFLKESKWIKSGDNARYEITLQGVIAAEEEDEEVAPLPPQVPKLTAAKE